MDATGFVNALIEDPDDLTSLLVFADWLDEQDDPHGELVRVQAQLLGWEPDLEKRSHLQQRERQLLQQLEPDWIARLRRHCSEWRIVGGLLDATFTISRFLSKSFVSQGAELLSACWVRRVRLRGQPSQLQNLALSPLLESVGILDLDGVGSDTQAMLPLLKSKHLKQLRELDLSNNALDDSAIESLVRQPWFRKLRRLSLRNNLLSSEGVATLWTAVKNTELHRLELQGNMLDQAQCQTLANWHDGRNRGEAPHCQGLPLRCHGALGMEFRLIPSGTFMMGSPNKERQRLIDEGPLHRVTLTKPFYLGVFEVTQQQYAWVMEDNPSHFNAEKSGGPHHPVENITAAQAQRFCKLLSQFPQEKKAKRLYRLPTEAEWEHACRAGDTFGLPFSGAAVLRPGDAVFNSSRTYFGAPQGEPPAGTQRVGSYKPTAWGLYDMHGNVWEWCADRFDPGYYTDKPEIDPKGGSSKRLRCLRGGCYSDFDRYCRCAVRGRNGSRSAHNGLGFRVVLELL